jgi:hypothetical protein
MPMLKRARSERPPHAEDCLESYAVWRESCETVTATYRWWGRCEAPQRSLAFDSYLAALDREEIAAQVHAEKVERLHALGR